jgi:cyclopropane fatty-acyl-phospholipid synthase-like methyltransferase
MKQLTKKQLWQNRHSKISRNFHDYKYHSHEILIQYLPKNPNLSIIEIGCNPGRNLIYFAKTFGYKVCGIDNSDVIKNVKTTLQTHGINNFELIYEDFFSYNSKIKYDIVFSSGFVEHFTDTSLVFQRHLDLLKDNGILIISLPNFKYGQYLLRILFGYRYVFKFVNLTCMSPDIWKNLAKQNDLYIR